MTQPKVIKWGILGTGKIAAQFTEQLLKLPDSQLVGVASRTVENAQKFAMKFHTKSFDSYEKLCELSDADVIYVATPTRFHREHCHLVLDGGKSLLCEKPFTESYGAAAAIIEKAKANNLFCMEAMWMRFNPYVQQAHNLIKNQTLGITRTVHGELGYKKDLSTLGTASEGKGAALAFGCYLTSLALYLFGTPKSVMSHAIANPQGGDETRSLLINYPEHIFSGFCSEGVTLANTVSIYAQYGCLTLNSPFIDATALDIVNLRDIENRALGDRVLNKINTVKTSLLGAPKPQDLGVGFRYEAAEVNRCLRAGKCESKIMPWSDSLLVHDILDTIIQGQTWQGTS